MLSGQALLDLAFEGPRLSLRFDAAAWGCVPRRALRDAAGAAVLAVGFPATIPPMQWASRRPDDRSDDPGQHRRSSDRHAVGERF